jgi:hypothetical protein
MVKKDLLKEIKEQLGNHAVSSKVIEDIKASVHNPKKANLIAMILLYVPAEFQLDSGTLKNFTIPELAKLYHIKEIVFSVSTPTEESLATQPPEANIQEQPISATTGGEEDEENKGVVDAKENEREDHQKESEDIHAKCSSSSTK